MKIGLLGYGTVGSAVARIVEQRCPELEVARILVLPEFLTEPRMTANFDDIVNEPAIDVVGGGPAGAGGGVGGRWPPGPPPPPQGGGG